MVFQNKNYRIIVDEVDRLTDISSFPHDKFIDPLEIYPSDLCKVFSVQILSENDRTQLILVGDFYSDVRNCILLEENAMIFLLNNQLLCIALESGAVSHRCDLSQYGCGIALYRIMDGYVIHGEETIIKISLEFDVLWTFCGQDIFVSVTGKNPFVLSDNSIRLCDFLDNVYIVDFNGKEL